MTGDALLNAEAGLAGGARLAARVRLHWHAWDSEFVVFDEASGRTHVLDTLTACTLLNIEAWPLSLHQIAAQVAEHASLDPGVVESGLPAILEQLVRVDLVEVVPQ